MKLFEINEVTKLAEPTAEARTIACFKEIIKRSRPIDGDHDGRKKTLNNMELAYVYFIGTYDSRFKLLHGEERVKAVKRLIGLKDEWKPDKVVEEAVATFVDLQTTESTKLVEVLGKSIESLTKYIETGQAQMANATLTMAQDVSKFLSILDQVSTTVEKLRQAKEMLNREQEALAKGRKGRTLNKFEIPD